MTYKDALRRVNDAILINGRDLERSLQIASGAVFLSAMALLPDAWSDIAAPQ